MNLLVFKKKCCLFLTFSALAWGEIKSSLFDFNKHRKWNELQNLDFFNEKKIKAPYW